MIPFYSTVGKITCNNLISILFKALTIAIHLAASVWDGVDVLEGPACAELSELLEIHGLVYHLPSNSRRMLKIQYIF